MSGLSRYAQRHHTCRVDEFGWRKQQLIVLENELLRVGVLASKGAEIVELRYKPRDLDVLWHAAQPVLSPAEYVPTAAHPAGNFLDFYAGGWQEILPAAGPGSTVLGAPLGMHGEASLLPWDVRVASDTAERVEVDFTVETLRTPFRIRRRMSIESGAARLRFEEELRNLGEEPVPFAWGHHPVFGPPFLAEGCRIELPPCQVESPAYSEGLRRRFATGGPSAFPYLGGRDGGPQRVDAVQPKESRTEDVLLVSGLSEGWWKLRNPVENLTLGLSWDAAVFPYLWCWQMYGGHWGYPDYGRSFALGLEPFNCPILPLAECVERKLARILGAGQAVTTALEFTVSA